MCISFAKKLKKLINLLRKFSIGMYLVNALFYFCIFYYYISILSQINYHSPLSSNLIQENTLFEVTKLFLKIQYKNVPCQHISPLLHVLSLQFKPLQNKFAPATLLTTKLEKHVEKILINLLLNFSMRMYLVNACYSTSVYFIFIFQAPPK